MKKRLSKALAAAGVASRRACEEIIGAGRVLVNGEPVLIPQTLVSWKTDRITVDGEQLNGEENKIYLLFNKPVGYLCTAAPNTKSILHFFSHLPHRLFTAGRLDKETSGLILLTNDGVFANRVIHPSFNVKKEYLAKTNQEITPDHLCRLSYGAQIEGVHVKPISVTKVRRGTLKIVVAEGKKHEVRLLLSKAQLTVRELKRIRIGPLTLGSLVEGTYRELSEQEKAFFLNIN